MAMEWTSEVIMPVLATELPTAAPVRGVRISRKMATVLLVLTCFDSFITWVEGVSQTEIDQHLQKGMELLARAQYSDALSHFHAAVDADPTNYMSYYKRATVFLALSRSRPALADLDKVLQLKSDFTKARVQRATVLVKMGRLDEAHIDAEKVLTKEPDNQEANRVYGVITPLQQQIRDAQAFIQAKNYPPAIEVLGEVLDQIPWDPTLRELRADAYMGSGNVIHAISDIRATTKLRSDDTTGYYKLSQLHYQLGEAEESLKEIRECLRLDPEHKDCYPFYKTLKKVAKFVTAAQTAQDEQQWEDCLDAARKVLKNEPEVQNIRFHAHDRLCHCQLKGGDTSEAQKACSEALKVREEPRLYCDRAEAFLAEDMLDEAVSDYRKALELDETFQRAKEGIQKAQKRQKQASKRDYYKILGVKRNANKRDVAKAYRKLAQKWHPDNFQDETEKKKAEKKFMDIAAAKEVLSDQEMRQKYDNGEDPLDPESQQEGHPFRGGHPFHGGHPFGGGNFQFKFHFN
ncbi:dnaJ homolog subfamily C member 3-like [Tigriopus californicus]|nr:dnaJ homolog subfamily C member 3-like [Tigriopus californicus]|eukprot:TCALIF_02292-PA protein Name:"Similar to DNAJC3 DnaJ homolog subfamily C member 3 (Bos taurus)" AED:0.03 eAED:0.03 QI:81/1/1/1/1/1/5/242/517